MVKKVMHMTEAEAAEDFRSLMSRVAEGAEVVIERNAKPLAVVRPAETATGRKISECIAFLEASAAGEGSVPAMDPEFAADLEEIISNRKPRDTSAWE